MIKLKLRFFQVFLSVIFAVVFSFVFAGNALAEFDLEQCEADAIQTETNCEENFCERTAGLLFIGCDNLDTQGETSACYALTEKWRDYCPNQCPIAKETHSTICSIGDQAEKDQDKIFDLSTCIQEITEDLYPECLNECQTSLGEYFAFCDTTFPDSTSEKNITCRQDAGYFNDDCVEFCEDEVAEVNILRCTTTSNDFTVIFEDDEDEEPVYTTPPAGKAEEGSQQKQGIAGQYQDILDQGIIFAGICESGKMNEKGEYIKSPCACRDNGDCTLEHMLQVFVNISVFILAISGSIVLLVLVYGGFMWITAHGNSQMVDTGKKTITGAVIGLIIIFGAYALVTLLVSVLTTGEIPESGQTLEDILQSEDVLNTDGTSVPGSSGGVTLEKCLSTVAGVTNQCLNLADDQYGTCDFGNNQTCITNKQAAYDNCNNQKAELNRQCNEMYK